VSLASGVFFVTLIILAVTILSSLAVSRNNQKFKRKFFANIPKSNQLQKSSAFNFVSIFTQFQQTKKIWTVHLLFRT
jgi:hypothetical protein